MTGAGRWSRIAAVLLLAGVTTACSVGVDLLSPTPERERYLMDAKRPVAAVAPPGAPSLAFGAVRVAPEFEGQSFVYRLDQRRFESDFHHQWFASPRDQVARMAAGWLRDSGIIGGVLPPALARQADYRLDLVVTRMYWDMRDAGRETAEVEIHAHLSRRSREGRVIVLERRAAAGEPVVVADMEQRVSAMERSFAAVFDRLEAELARALAEDSGS